MDRQRDGWMDGLKEGWMGGCKNAQLDTDASLLTTGTWIAPVTSSNILITCALLGGGWVEEGKKG